MRYRFTFFIGLAVGFVIGARAGRERYEQLKKLAGKAKDSPAMQQAAGAAQAQAASLARAAKDRAAQTVGDRIPGMRAREANGHAQPNGAYSPAPGTPGSGGQPRP
jgi:hypothetical protein